MTFDWTVVWAALRSPLMWQGAWTTVWLAAVSMTFGFALGMIAALMRLYGPAPLRYLSRLYLWLFRGTPLLVQLIVIYTGLPTIGISLSVTAAAVIGFSINEGAYESEIIRAGVESVPRGQIEAARAVGMPERTIFVRIIMPQAMRLIIPPLGNSFNLLIKGTSLASVISMAELLRQTESLAQLNFKVLEMFLAAGVFYLAMTTLWGLVQTRLEKHFGRSVAAGKTGRQAMRADLMADRA